MSTKPPTMSTGTAEETSSIPLIVTSIPKDNSEGRSYATRAESIHFSSNIIQPEITASAVIPSELRGGTTEKITELTPEFRVEGSGHGDSSVTVSPGSTVKDVTKTAIGTVGTDSDGQLVPHSIPFNENAGVGHSSLSRQNSEEMPLSLVSWYSEPCDSSHLNRPCCVTVGENAMPDINSMREITTEAGSDRSEEKENKTPKGTSETLPNFFSSQSNKQGMLKNSMMIKIHAKNSVQRRGRLDKKSDTDKTDRDHSISTPGERCVRKQNGVDCPGQIECPRCSRKSKSGTVTPVSPSRTPKRQIPYRTPVPDFKKPIKSILKNESRGSSGSEKQSSMDSLGSGSGSGTSPVLQMSRSDSGPRTKFLFQQGIKPEDVVDGDYSGLKRIERYATIRIRKKAMETLDLRVDPPRKLSFEDIHSVPDSSTDLMIKSMPYLEKQSSEDNSESSFQRQGSIRVRKGSPNWTPCATRTTALRLLKIQESKAKQANGFEKGAHSGSRENVYNPIPQSQAIKNGSGAAKKETKVFPKLSSSFLGQTTSSSQKRIRQERGVQTEPILNIKMSHQHGLRRSATPISPTPISDDIPVDMKPEDEIKYYQAEARKYKAKTIKYQYIYEAAELEKLALENHLRELQNESKEMINFLQDEKALLSEELLSQKKLKTEVLELEDALSKARNEYEMLRTEYEQHIVTGERINPINRDMGQLIRSFKKHNELLKGVAQRYRKKYKILFNDYTKVKQRNNHLEMKLNTLDGEESQDVELALDACENIEKDPFAAIENFPEYTRSEMSEIVKGYKILEEKNKALCKELNQRSLRERELKLLLDTCKLVGKDGRDKVEIMASERKIKTELEESKELIMKLEENRSEEIKKLADAESVRKIALLENQVRVLEKQLASLNSDGEELMTEMERTGQAFEDMQEFNFGLIEEIREKNDLIQHCEKHHSQPNGKENGGNDDTVLLKGKTGMKDKDKLEEFHEYKELLTCSSCKVNRKDAVLNKFFRVVCLDCLKNLDKTKEGRCPKCNACFDVLDCPELVVK